MIPSNWPVNYMEKRLYVAELQRRILRLQKIKKSVVVHSRLEPARAQFEAAYVGQTGLPLPIEVGTKLLWYDLRAGQIKAYSTAYDLQNGTVSSGEIYPMIDVEADSRGAFRLLAVQGDSVGWKDPFINLQAGGVHISLDFVENLKKGLEAYMLLFMTNSSSLPITYQVRTNDVSAAYKAVYNAADAGANVADTTAGTLPTQLLVKSGDTTGMANVYCNGMVFISNPTSSLEGEMQQYNTFAPGGSGFSGGIATTFAANSIQVNNISFIHQGASSPLVEPIVPNWSLPPRSNCRAWLYGIFSKSTYGLES